MINEIKRYKGDTYSIEAVLTKGTVPIDFTDVNITATFTYTKGAVRNSIAGDALGQTDGSISFPFNAATEVAISNGKYKYDIQVTDNGEIRTYVKDTLVITDDVTK